MFFSPQGSHRYSPQSLVRLRSILNWAVTQRVVCVIGRSPVRFPSSPFEQDTEPQIAPDEQLHGSLRHQCMNVCVNG